MSLLILADASGQMNGQILKMMETKFVIDNKKMLVAVMAILTTNIQSQKLDYSIRIWPFVCFGPESDDGVHVWISNFEKATYKILNRNITNVNWFSSIERKPKLKPKPKSFLNKSLNRFRSNSQRDTNRNPAARWSYNQLLAFDSRAASWHAHVQKVLNVEL